MRDAHGKTATFADELRCIEPARDAFAVERRRHHDKAQVGTQVRLHVERERGAEVAVQVAFVEFIEEDRGDAGQFRVVLDHAREDAFGDDFDARRLRDLRFEADAVADRFADTLAALRGHDSAAARAAMRRGSSSRMRPSPRHGASSNASGTRVVLPAPGGACSTSRGMCASVERICGSSASMGAGSAMRGNRRAKTAIVDAALFRKERLWLAVFGLSARLDFANAPPSKR
jgi:hypothetical protein